MDRRFKDAFCFGALLQCSTIYAAQASASAADITINPTIWVPLLASIVGGLIGGSAALLGVVISPRLAHRYQTERDRTALRREKLEALVIAAYSFRDWHGRRIYEVVHGTGVFSEPSPLDKIQALTSLYFPELNLDLLYGSGEWCVHAAKEERDRKERDYKAWREDLERSAKTQQRYWELSREVIKLAVVARALLP